MKPPVPSWPQDVRTTASAAVFSLAGLPIGTQATRAEFVNTRLLKELKRAGKRQRGFKRRCKEMRKLDAAERKLIDALRAGELRVWGRKINPESGNDARQAAQMEDHTADPLFRQPICIDIRSNTIEPDYSAAEDMSEFVSLRQSCWIADVLFDAGDLTSLKIDPDLSRSKTKSTRKNMAEIARDLFCEKYPSGLPSGLLRKRIDGEINNICIARHGFSIGERNLRRGRQLAAALVGTAA